MDQFPTLALIDRARGDGERRFADQPNAAYLEHLARAVADAYWSESVWLTGIVPAAGFQAVCIALDAACLAATPTVQLVFADAVHVVDLTLTSALDRSASQNPSTATA